MNVLGRLLPAVMVLAAAAEAFPEIIPKRYLQLNQRCQEVARLLARGDSRLLYDRFVPQFRADVPYARFDSSVRAWYRGGRLKRVRAQLVDVRGLGGHASTWVFFDGEPTYRYVYQNWLYTDAGWQLVWLSNVLGQSLQFGDRDSAALTEVAQAALDHITAPGRIAELGPGLLLPDTVVVSWPGSGPGFHSATRPVRTVTPANENVLMPRVPYYFRFGQIRVLGKLATCALDVRPTRWRGPGAPRNARSLQFYFDHRGDSWLLNSSGKRW